ncbi:hypothetical protein ASPZODRAFT_92402 [Penicilliopsis zonata CBS 506.65]|uniref:Xylanolytic transcriptional activator regulatory domain-containing protein n=1 Tax=Penicilliopsis zonata CBS 506.65 TaxID=1073090 RepID=A0A1L9SLZ8_9EURO|nr:hypothetical protein ASPZODRAFT_92402 [Penicilliopsis zonata CBS 506.65]OJJ48121.1 hypothetical protein ASPZODRAFT_92402 [Penicilliopsis zonata CBS 506.65]
MAVKRKVSHAFTETEGDSNRVRFETCRPSTAWNNRPSHPWQRTMTNATMGSAISDLEFDPLTAIWDKEPRFFKPLPSRIPSEDREFLRFRGALTTPESGLRDELLRCYIRWVHGSLPILDLHRFLSIIAQNDPHGKISLLLFQTVMFVGTAFVDIKHLQTAGFATRKLVQDEFYRRVKLLYTFECEEDRLALLQSYLLLTSCSDQENTPHTDTWDLVASCTTLAYSIGLDQDPSQTALDPGMKHLRVRLWWSLYTCDRMTAMELRRPPHINGTPSDAPILTLEDFDLKPFHSFVVERFQCRQLENVCDQRRLATMFIEKVKLCQHIGEILSIRYSPLHRDLGRTSQPTITLAPRQAPESEMTQCNRRLELWAKELPQDAHFISPSSPKPTMKDGDDVLFIHSSMLKMLWHAASSAFHRPWLANSRIANRVTAGQLRSRDSVMGIQEISQNIYRLNLIRFLPQCAVMIISLAAAVHLEDSMAENPAVRNSSMARLQACIQVLIQVKEIYPSAVVELARLEAAVRKQSACHDIYSPILLPELNNCSNTSPPQAPIHIPPDIHPNLQQANKQATRNMASELGFPRPTPPVSYNLDSIFQSPPSSTAIDLDTFPGLSPDESLIDSEIPDLEADWTADLVDEWAKPDFNRDYTFSSVSDQKRHDSFSLSTPIYKDLGRRHITGDLDTDLGLLPFGDEFF